MYAFQSTDLGTLIYVTDITSQPDNYTYNAYNPLEDPAPFDLYGMFAAQIEEARNNNHVFDSDTIRVAKIYSGGGYDTFAFLVKVSYNPNNDNIRFYAGYVTPASSKPGAPSQWTHHNELDVGYVYLNDNRYMGYLYCHQIKARDMTVTPPGYTGLDSLRISIAGVEIWEGTWHEHSTQHPYGYMDYIRPHALLYNRADIPNCIPCQSNDETSRSTQQLTVGMMVNSGSEQIYTQQTDIRFVADDGSYDPDPPPVPPTPPGPPTPFDPSEPEPYPDEPTPEDSSDPVPIPGLPPIGVTSAGFINVYNPTVNSLQGLGDILFPQFSTPSDVTDAIYQLYNVIANQNLINYVIDCHVIPVQPLVGNNKNIKVGYRDTGISVPAVSYDYVDATCGSISLGEFFHGYADYAGTVSKLYLPFIGFVDMKPEFWQGGTLSVDYKFNVIDGSFMCYVSSTSSKSQLAGSIIAQYAGNACMHLPLTGVNYAQMVSGIVGSVASIATKGTASAVAGGAWSAANTIARGGDVQQSNGYNSTAALLGVRKPYLMIERAVPAFPAKYGHDKGYPANITTQLANIKGYTEISDIDLTGLPFTQAEIEELRGLLKEGVYF